MDESPDAAAGGVPGLAGGDRRGRHVSLLSGTAGQNRRVAAPSEPSAVSPDRRGAAALTSQRLVALFAAGLLLLNFPLLALWDRPLSVAGLPLFPLALFGIWAGLIAALAWLLETAPEPG
jgi:hypothetical protein